MHPNIERCLTRLRYFADLLSWPDLQPNYHNADGQDVVWYTSGENNGSATDLFLQINEHPIGNTAEFVGSVYAVRYKLWTGWHSFPFPDSMDTIKEALKRTDLWLDNNWFTVDENRKIYVDCHPESSGFDWERIREASPPYEM